MSLEQREQDIRSALTKVGVQADSQIVKLIKQGDMAQVYINEQYFDTYDFNEGQFLEHHSEFITDDFLIEEDKQRMYAVMYHQNRSGDPSYVETQLALPASAEDIEAALKQAGISNAQDCNIEYLRWKEYVFDSDEIMEASIEELNFFSRCVFEMDQETRLVFEGCLLANQKSQSIKDLINLTYSLENVRILHGINDDTQLGRYYAENGWVAELQEIPETVAAFIDYEKIGSTMREAEDGVFLEGCYINNENNELVQVYDGKTLPDKHDAKNIFTVYASFGDTMQEKSLRLPADEKQVSAFLKELEHIILSYQSRQYRDEG